MNETFKKILMERVNNIPKRDDIKEYECPICRDLHYTFNDLGQAVPCKCKDKFESKEKLKKCGLDEVFKNKTFRNYKVNNETQLAARDKAINYCNNFLDTNSSLIITGRPGVGKTHLGAATMINLIGKNVLCKYELYTTMLINLKQSVMDETNFIREMDKYKVPRVLFLDDFLKGKPTDADLKYIFEIVNERYLKKKPMIISTEKSIDEIVSWDEAVASRLVEMAKGNIIEFGTDIENYRFYAK